MKTMSFGKINIKYTEGDGGCIIEVSAPGQGAVEVDLTADELMMFLVEVGNGLRDARAREVVKEVQRNLMKEERR